MSFNTICPLTLIPWKERARAISAFSLPVGELHTFTGYPCSVLATGKCGPGRRSESLAAVSIMFANVSEPRLGFRCRACRGLEGPLHINIEIRVVKYEEDNNGLKGKKKERGGREREKEEARKIEGREERERKEREGRERKRKERGVGGGRDWKEGERGLPRTAICPLQDECSRTLVAPRTRLQNRPFPLATQ